MKQHQPSHKAVTIFIAMIAALLLLPYLASAGQLQPTAAPAPTMHTLEEIYHDLQIIKANLGLGPRFVDNGNGTVTDGKTGLIWLKNAQPCGYKDWNDAKAYCTSLASGQAGLTDGSTAGQWRLPTKEELEGMGTNPPTTWYSGFPSVPWTMPDAPFTSVYPGNYWSGTEYDSYNAWIVGSNGYVINAGKVNPGHVWPVRDGQ